MSFFIATFWLGCGGTPAEGPEEPAPVVQPEAEPSTYNIPTEAREQPDAAEDGAQAEVAERGGGGGEDFKPDVWPPVNVPEAGDNEGYRGSAKQAHRETLDKDINHDALPDEASEAGSLAPAEGLPEPRF